MAKEKEGTLLVVDDNRSILAAVQLLMGNYFARVVTLPSPNQLLTTLHREPVDVIPTPATRASTGCRRFTATIPTSRWCSSRPMPTSTLR